MGHLDGLGEKASEMALFAGTFENKVDGKGRVSLPADFRAELPEDAGRFVYVFPSPKDDALEACDKPFLERMAAAIEEAPLFSEEEDDLGASIIAQARKAQIDETGRIVLPKDFMEFADISGKAVFVGRAARFQIWSPDRFEAHAKKARERMRGRTLTLKPKGGGQ